MKNWAAGNRRDHDEKKIPQIPRTKLTGDTYRGNRKCLVKSDQSVNFQAIVHLCFSFNWLLST
jgi:hypothetical protein